MPTGGACGTPWCTAGTPPRIAAMFALLAQIQAVLKKPEVPYDGEISYAQATSESRAANV
jgi:hypothetical protein